MPDSMIYVAVLVAAMAHAGWNYLVKSSSDQVLTTAGMRGFGMLFAVLLLIVVPWPHVSAMPYLLGQVVCACLYYLFLLNAYRVGEFSAVYPIARGLAPVSVLLAAGLLQVDVLAPGEIVGTVLISVGILLFATTLTHHMTSLGYAILTGLMIGAYTFLAGLGVRQSGSVIGYLAWTELMIGLVIVPVCWSLRKGRVTQHFKAQWRTLILTAVLSAGGFGIVLWAFAQLPLGPVTAVRETSVAFAVLLGVILLNERLSTAKIGALVSVFTGLIVLALYQ